MKSKTPLYIAPYRYKLGLGINKLGLSAQCCSNLVLTEAVLRRSCQHWVNQPVLKLVSQLCYESDPSMARRMAQLPARITG